jgi:hypothetical protein
MRSGCDDSKKRGATSETLIGDDVGAVTLEGLSIGAFGYAVTNSLEECGI